MRKKEKSIASHDSGGPAVYQDEENDGAFKQIGIASFFTRSKSGSRYISKYSNFAKVSSFIDFIREHVKDL